MANFKNTLISCLKCGKLISVKVRDFERGEIRCSHVGCAQLNPLTQPYYDERVLEGLSEFGRLADRDNPALVYPLRHGLNVIGHSPRSAVSVARTLHDGKCYISRQHCTVEVLFDKWKGSFRYQVQDGAFSENTQQYKSSLNGTLVDGYHLQAGERIDIGDQGLLGLGGKDFFRLQACRIPPKMLESYLMQKPIEPDETQ